MFADDKESNGQFKKGRAKTGGRKKGTKNKRTTDIMELLSSINPVGRLEEILNTTEDEGLKTKICLDLLPYMYPKRRAVELTDNSTNQPLTIIRFADGSEHDMSEISI